MVKAIFRYDDQTGEIEMRVRGHADFAELGKDPVCAGASVLAFTAAQCIDMLNGLDLMEKKPSIRITKGNVRVKCKPKPEGHLQTWMVFLTAQTGMRLLAESYPRHASVKVFETAPADSIEESSTSRTD